MHAARLVRSIAAAGGVLLGAGHAMADAGGMEVEARAEPLSCLQSPFGATPTYPAGAGTDAVVRVQMRFVAPDGAPEVSIRSNSGTEPFANAVRTHVGAYRLPCLPAGRPFDAVQEFQFVVKPDRPTVLNSAARERDGTSRLTPACMAGVENVPPPAFPSSRVTPVKSGNVLVKLTFAAPDKPPVAEVLYDSDQPRLAAAVLDSVANYRLPCLAAGDPPLVATRTFAFRYEGQQGGHFKSELTLPQLLRAIKGIDQQKVRFDFSTMGCPFKVTVAPYRPYASNRVQEVGDRHPDRREFIEWLRNVTFDFPPDLMRTALGQATTVSVACVLLDLS